MNKCWRLKGCPFNSNNSLNYMKCLQNSYSVEQCRKDNEIKYLSTIIPKNVRIQGSKDSTIWIIDY